jgi:hypothetical protein
MTECHFDTQTGQQVIGEAALSLRMEQSGAAVVPLQDLILARSFPYEKGDFAPAQLDDWDHDDYVAYGRWVIELTAIDGEPQPVTTQTLERLQVLGIGPSHKRIYTRFGSLSAFKEIIGSPAGYDRLRFADWGTDDYVRYALGLERSLGHPPSRAEYQAAFKAGRGPSQALIKDRFGGTSMLNELIGHPNIDLWAKDDFIAWGIRVVRANPNREFIDKVVEALSRRKRGPSQWTIDKYFGGMTNFREVVIGAHAEQEAAKLQRVTTYQHMIRRGELPADFGDMPADELLTQVAKYIITRRCAPDITSKKQRSIAANSPRTFIGALRKAMPHVSAGHIETEAVMLGVFDDIWPLESALENYHVTDEEIQERRAYHATYARARRAAGNVAVTTG